MIDDQLFSDGEEDEEGNDFKWLPAIVEKLAQKHNVQVHEVEEVFYNEEDEMKTSFHVIGNEPGENVYQGFGRTDAGRYLFVAFIEKLDGRALILSARDMELKEKKRYGSK